MSAPDFLNITAPPEWTLDAVCAQVDGDLFFPEKGGSTREAKRVCAGCPVQTECLAYALAHDERFGVWGGVTERERDRMRRDVTGAPAPGRPMRASDDPRVGTVRRLAATHTDPEIAVRLGCSARTVLRIRRAAGVAPALPCGRARAGGAA